MSFFEVKNGEITCPELDDYKVVLDERRKAQSEGGKKGQAIKKRKESNVIYLEGLPKGSEKRREEQRRAEQKRAEQVFIEETLEEDLKELSAENQAWVDDYDSEE
jgi:recombinational DNA repair protein (RecF pathway)